MYARILLVPLLCLTLAGADWTRFHGPNGTGVATDKNIPVKWSPSDIQFKVKLTGSGHSSPIVVGKQLFLQSATKTARLLLCHDAITGKELWAKTIPGGIGRTHRKSSLASATPCSDGERVYCVFWNGKGVSLYAFTLEGKLAWEQNLGSFKSQHGPGFSPVVYNGKVYVNNDQDGTSVLRAFDSQSGKPAWEVKRPPFRACYSTPFLLEQGAKGKELIVVSTAGITGYEPDTGKVVWNYTWSFPNMPLRTVGSPIAADGHVFACSGDGSGARGMIAVKLGGTGDVTKTHLAWEKDNTTPYVPSLLAREGHLYVVNDNGTAVCYESRTGKEVWRGRLGGNVSSSPVMIDGKVYVADEKGDVFVFEATPTGFKLLAKNTLGELVMASPAVANGRLYYRGVQHLFCIGKP